MKTETKLILSKQWILFGAISGIVANILYPILLTISLPSYLEIFLAGIFGILISMSGFAIHHTMIHHKPTILTQIGAQFVFVFGTLLNVMLVVQLTFLGYLGHYKKQLTNQHDLDLFEWIRKTVNPVHLGLDVSADFFVGIATIVFSIAMIKHPFFGKLWSSSGMLFAIILLVVKFYAFPLTPYELDMPYIFGPILALWYLAVCIQCLRKRNQLL